MKPSVWTYTYALFLLYTSLNLLYAVNVSLIKFERVNESGSRGVEGQMTVFSPDRGYRSRRQSEREGNVVRDAVVIVGEDVTVAAGRRLLPCDDRARPGIGFEHGDVARQDYRFERSK